MQEDFNMDIAQAGGWTTVASSFFLSVMELLGDVTVNDFLQGILLVGSIVFLYFKIKNSIMDLKLKKKELAEDDDKQDKQ
jgi:hypothetical protein